MEVTDEKADFGCRNKVGRTEKVGDISCRTVAGLAAIFVHAERRISSKTHEINGDLSVLQWDILVCL